MSRLAARNQDLDALLGIPKGATGEEYLEGGIQALNTSAQWVARAGRSFKLAKELLPHGQFHSALTERGVEVRSAQQAIQVAEFLERVPVTEAAKLVKAGYTKVLALAQADPEVIQDITESGETDEVTALSVRDLRELLKQRGRKISQLETKLDTERARHHNAQRRLTHLHSVDDLPLFASVVREEAIALTDQAGFMVESLESVVREHLLKVTNGDETFEHFAPIAAGTTFKALDGLLAQLRGLQQQLQDRFGEQITGSPTAAERLTAAELKIYQERREVLLKPLEIAAEQRAIDRENKTPGKRGRKRKPAA